MTKKTACLECGVAHDVRPCCCVPGCDKTADSRGLCNTHHKAYSRRHELEVRITICIACGVPHERREVCCVSGCRGVMKTRGLCALHYGRWAHGRRKGGTIERLLVGNPKVTACVVCGTNHKRRNVCCVKSCKRTPSSRGLCRMHYYRWLSWGHWGGVASVKTGHYVNKGRGYTLAHGHPLANCNSYVADARLDVLRRSGHLCTAGEIVRNGIVLLRRRSRIAYCSECGASIVVKPYRLRDKNYCSVRCRTLGRKGIPNLALRKCDRQLLLGEYVGGCGVIRLAQKYRMCPSTIYKIVKRFNNGKELGAAVS